ncbi:uncharacterized protein [Ptychodera flava]|uniref:uncharacterized protein n=1 Tax=Ptychodera flava TaxID=63121 RepID=UPI003969DDF4
MEIAYSFDELSRALSGLDDLNLSQEESQILAIDVLLAMDAVLTSLRYSVLQFDDSKDNRYLLTESTMKTADHLSKFVLRNAEPGTGPIVLDTPSIELNLQSDYVHNLSNCSITIGGGNGFVLPSSDKIFSDLQAENETLHRIVKCLKKIPTGVHDLLYNDVIALSFTNSSGNELEVKDTKEDILIIFASDSPPVATHVLMEGLYLEVNDVTYFGSIFEVRL